MAFFTIPTIARMLLSWPWIAIPLTALIVGLMEHSDRPRHEERLPSVLVDEQQEHRLADLRGLQRTLDPLLAAQVYNRSYSALCQLPAELRLLIVRQLDGDAVTLFCLGRVSRAFRVLIRGPSVWARMPLPASLGFAEKVNTTWRLSPAKRAQLRWLLDVDGICDACQYTPSWWGGVSSYRNPRVLSRCPFTTWGPSWRIHCSICPCHHDVGVFSQHWSLPDPRGWEDRSRRCLGREGAVRLCEHVSIPWSAVEQHIIAWQRRGRRPDDTRNGGNSNNTSDTGNAEDTDDTGSANDTEDTEDASDTDDTYDAYDLYDTDPSHLGGLNALIAECRHPMHNTSCGPGQPPTWPRARLQNVDNHNKQDMVLLVMEWAAHSGVGAFKPTPLGGDNRPAARELRALFHKYRSPGQPAEELVPRYPSGPLPEMACFDPGARQCLRYDVGDQGSSGSGNEEEKEEQQQQQRGTPDVDIGTPTPLLLQPARFFSSSCHQGKPRGFVPVGGARRHDFYSRHCYWRGLDRGGEPGQCVWMRQHWPRGGDGEGSEEGVKGRRPCLVTTYRRTVVVCDNDSSKWTPWDHPSARLPPTHDWFHAMDPDTCGQPRCAVPPCKNRACINYYKRPKTVECLHSQARLHEGCGCRRRI